MAPVVVGELVEGENESLVRVRCPHCGGQHVHVQQEQTVRESYRLCRCSREKEDPPREYLLTLATQ